MLLEDELRQDTGRCVGGTFVRLVHLPTGIVREIGPIGQRQYHEIRMQFEREIEAELREKGLMQYIVKPEKQ